MTKIYAVHFLQDDGRHLLGSHSGRDAKPWKVGETRTATGILSLCENGYHFAPTWEAAYQGGFIYGPVACIVEVDQKPDNMACDGFKGVSRKRKLIEMHTMEPRDFRRYKNMCGSKRGAKKFAEFMGKLTGWYAVP